MTERLVGLSFRKRLVSGSPIYYGWVILLVSSLGMIMTSPGQTYAVSIFIEHFIEDLGIGRSLISVLYTLGTLIGSFALGAVGHQVDRHGPRLMGVVITVFFGLACIYMGFVSNALMLGVGFIAVRMLGQGSLGLVCTNIINQWWVRRRGMMSGIAGILRSLFGTGGFPNLIYLLIPLFGWRFTYQFFGLILLLVMVPIVFVFFRNRPEDYGLQPDGGQPGNLDDGTGGIELEKNWTLQEAIHTSGFWVLTIGISSIAMLSTGLVFHMVSIFEDKGLSLAVAASVFAPIALTSAIVRLGSGIFVNRIPMRVLQTLALIFQALCLWMAQSLQGIEMAFTYGVVLGITSGLHGTVYSVAYPTYFGRKHLGSIQGFASTIIIAGSAIGPMPFGIARDLLGSYNNVFTFSTFIMLFLSVLSLSTLQRTTKK